MTHFMPRAEVQKTSHVMLTDCPCKPKLRGVFKDSWANMVGLALDHQVLVPDEPILPPVAGVCEEITQDMLDDMVEHVWQAGENPPNQVI